MLSLAYSYKLLVDGLASRIDRLFGSFSMRKLARLVCY